MEQESYELQFGIMFVLTLQITKRPLYHIRRLASHPSLPYCKFITGTITRTFCQRIQSSAAYYYGVIENCQSFHLRQALMEECSFGSILISPGILKESTRRALY